MTEELAHTRIEVTGESAYPIIIGRSVLGELPRLVGERAKKILIIHSGSVATYAESMRTQLQSHYDQVLVAEVPDAEAAKRVEVAAFCWQVLGQADFTRTDAIIGLGGGAVTDLAGFVAATWLRGVTLVQVPTTVLAMVDASVGGKTGINTAEGKNLVGSFYAPSGVLIDLDFAASLPENEVRAGLAEVVKCGFIADTDILGIIESHLEDALDTGSGTFAELVTRAVRVKAHIVSADFKEAGQREFLNYGHTLGHAIEHAERYQWRHGAAISIGMVFAAELGRLTGSLSDEDVARHRRILSSLGLPVSYPQGRWPGLLATMQRDKKARAGMLRFVVLDAIGKPSILAGTDDSMLFLAYQELSSPSES